MEECEKWQMHPRVENFPECGRNREKPMHNASAGRTSISEDEGKLQGSAFVGAPGIVDDFLGLRLRFDSVARKICDAWMEDLD